MWSHPRFTCDVDTRPHTSQIRSPWIGCRNSSGLQSNMSEKPLSILFSAVFRCFVAIFRQSTGREDGTYLGNKNSTQLAYIVPWIS
ncbi:unnamed protein product [Ixodes pacificus]